MQGLPLFTYRRILILVVSFKVIENTSSGFGTVIGDINLKTILDNFDLRTLERISR